MDISVVMSAYNVGEYIEQAVKSVLAQSFAGEMELIVVDDASTDGTAGILAELAHEDSRVRLITHGQNMGAGQARRTGIEAARGEYIITVDGDDWLRSDFLAHLHKVAKETGAEIVSGGISVMKENDAWECVSYGNLTTEGDDKVTKFWGEKIVFMNNKLIHRRLHELVPYCTRRFIEDTPVIVPMMQLANKVVYVANDGYFYRMRPTSLTHEADAFKYNLYRSLCMQDLIAFFSKENPGLLQKLPFGNTYAGYIAEMKKIAPTAEMIAPYIEDWVEYSRRLIIEAL